MLAVWEADEISGLQADGILGMAPKDQTGGEGELLVEKLASQGVIGYNGFGVDYQFTTGTSYITLGGWDRDIVANESDFTWIDLVDTQYWSLEYKGGSYGNQEFEISASRGILDTGTSLTYFSGSDFDVVWALLTEGKTCGRISSGSYQGYLACNCDSIDEFEDITLKFGSVTTFLEKRFYVEFIDNVLSQDVCIFYIDTISVSLGNSYILLGDSYLRQYYIYHDAEKERVGYSGKVIVGAYLFPSLSLLTLSALLWA
jgi:hypothetical protein